MAASNNHEDSSNGWEAIANDFISLESVLTGNSIIANWAKTLEPGQDILDVGCGFGGSYTQGLIDNGVKVYGIDASSTLVEEYLRRYPSASVKCEAAEVSAFYEKKFDGILSIGMIFLLSRENQILALQRMATALKPGGKILFTSPYQICCWDDLLTGQKSVSLGRNSYVDILQKYGLTLINEYTDESENHYFDFQYANDLNIAHNQ